MTKTTLGGLVFMSLLSFSMGHCPLSLLELEKHCDLCVVEPEWTFRVNIQKYGHFCEHGARYYGTDDVVYITKQEQCQLLQLADGDTECKRTTLPLQKQCEICTEVGWHYKIIMDEVRPFCAPKKDKPFSHAVYISSKAKCREHNFSPPSIAANETTNTNTTKTSPEATVNSNENEMRLNDQIQIVVESCLYALCALVLLVLAIFMGRSWWTRRQGEDHVRREEDDLISMYKIFQIKEQSN